MTARSRIARKALYAAVSAATLLAARSIYAETIAGLDKGHQIFLDRGIQIQANSFTYSSWTASRWASSNFTTISWQNESPMSNYYSAPGVPWGRWIGVDGNFYSNYYAPTSSEQPFASNYITLQLSDEQDINNWNSDSNLRNNTITWFNNARANFPNTLLFLNQQGNEDTAANLAAYMNDAHPDMLMYDSYPITRFITIVGGSLKTMYEDQAKYRALGLAGNDGTGNHPIPVGHYVESFTDRNGNNFWPRLASESETRLQHFAAWTFGEKLVNSFVYNAPGVSSIESEFFNGNGVSSPTAAFTQVAELNRQSRNLGPALVRLISKDIRFIPGQHSGGVDNDTPAGMTNWSAGAGGDSYIMDISATSQSTLNGGLKGDVLAGYFKPLDESMDGSQYNNETYFMLTNGLSDANGSAAACRQQITVNFDFGASGISALRRLSRDTGQVESVALTHLSGAVYQLALTLDGGTGDLFKFDDGAPFVGIEAAPPPPPGIAVWWDNDPAANDTGTGAGLGGSGTWDTAQSRWYNGSANIPWSASNDAIFWGTAGTVTLSGAQSAHSLTFKTTGYALSGAGMTMTAPSITTDGGVTATINCVIGATSGITKLGPGILVLGTANSYTGGTIISAGTLRVSADNNLGASAGGVTFTGGILSATAGFSSPRPIAINTGGGGIDNGSGLSTTFAGAITGAAGNTLTKTGEGTLVLDNPTPRNGASSAWLGNITVSAGTLMVGSGATTGFLPGYEPTQYAGFPPTVPTISLASGTSLIFNQSNTHNDAVNISGAGAVIMAGTGTQSLVADNTYTGPTTVSSGTLRIGFGDLGSIVSPTVSVAAAAQLHFRSKVDSTYAGIISGAGSVTKGNGNAPSILYLTGDNTYTGGTTITFGNSAFDFGGTLSIGNGGTSGSVIGNITNNSALIFNRSNILTYGGVISGSGTVTKLGAGTLAVSSANTYTGGTTVSGGTLQIGAGSTSGSIPGNITDNANVAFNRSDTFSYGGIVSGTGSLTQLGPGMLVLNSTNTYSGATTVSGGTLRVAGGAAIADSSAVTLASSAATFDLNGTSETIGSLAGSGNVNLGAGTLTAGANNSSTAYGGVIAGAGNLKKIGTGTMTVSGTSTYTGATTVSAGTLAFAASQHLNALTISSGMATLVAMGTRSLVVTTLTTTSGGKLDLTDNDAIFTGMTRAAVESLITSGRTSSGSWLGTGITSSAAAANSATAKTALGVIQASDAGYTSFAGQTVSAASIVVKYTYAGDADLSGTVNFDDFNQLLVGFTGQQPARWLTGDFNYSGAVDFDDFNKFIAGFNEFNSTGVVLAADERFQLAALGPSPVPEPAAITPIAFSFTLLRRRRPSRPRE